MLWPGFTNTGVLLYIDSIVPRTRLHEHLPTDRANESIYCDSYNVLPDLNLQVICSYIVRSSQVQYLPTSSRVDHDGVAKPSSLA